MGINESVWDAYATRDFAKSYQRLREALNERLLALGSTVLFEPFSKQFRSQ